MVKRQQDYLVVEIASDSGFPALVLKLAGKNAYAQVLVIAKCDAHVRRQRI